MLRFGAFISFWHWFTRSNIHLYSFFVFQAKIFIAETTRKLEIFCFSISLLALLISLIIFCNIRWVWTLSGDFFSMMSFRGLPSLLHFSLNLHFLQCFHVFLLYFYLCLSVFLYLSLCLAISVSVSISLYVCPSVFLSAFFFFIFLYLSHSPSLPLSLYLIFFHSISLSHSLAFSLSIIKLSLSE